MILEQPILADSYFNINQNIKKLKKIEKVLINFYFMFFFNRSLSSCQNDMLKKATEMKSKDVATKFRQI